MVALGAANTFATAAVDISVKIWDFDTGTLVNAIPPSLPGGHQLQVNAIAPLRDTLLATAGGDSRVVIWNTLQSPPLSVFQLTAHVGAVYGVAFTRDGLTMFTAGDDRLVKVRRRLARRCSSWVLHDPLALFAVFAGMEHGCV